MALNWTEIYTSPKMAFADSLSVLTEIKGVYVLRCSYIGYTAEEMPTGHFPEEGYDKINIGYVLQEYTGFIQTLITYCETNYAGLFHTSWQRKIYIDRDGTVYSGSGSISDGGVNNGGRDFEDPDNWGWWVKRLQTVLDDLIYVYSLLVGGTNPYGNASGYELFEDWTNECAATGAPEWGYEIPQLAYPSPPEIMGSYHSFSGQLGVRTELILDGSWYTFTNRARAWRTVDFGLFSLPAIVRTSYGAYAAIKRDNLTFTRFKGRSGELASDLTWQCIGFFTDPRLESWGPDYEYDTGDGEVFYEYSASSISLDPLPDPTTSKYQTGTATFGASSWAGLNINPVLPMGSVLYIREQINFPNSVSETLPRVYEAGKTCVDYYYGNGRDNLYHASVLRNNNPGAYDVGIVHYEVITL